MKKNNMKNTIKKEDYIIQWKYNWITTILKYLERDIKNDIDLDILKLELKHALWKLGEPFGRKESNIIYYSKDCLNNNKIGDRHHIIKLKNTISDLIANKNDKKMCIKIIALGCAYAKLTKPQHNSLQQKSDLEKLNSFELYNLKNEVIRGTSVYHYFNEDLYDIGIKILEDIKHE